MRSIEERRAKQAQRDYNIGLITQEELDRAVRLAELVKRTMQQETKGAN